MDGLGPEAAVEPDVAMVLENGVVPGFDYPGILGGVGQLAVVHPQLRTDGEPALLLDLPVAQFLPTGLDGEIGLADRDNFLGRIGILDDEVAGVARHHHGLHRTLSAFADPDHIGDINEMILQSLAAVETGGLGLGDDGFKVPVIGVAEHTGEVAAGPVFVASRICPANGFKRGDFVAHGWCSSGLGDVRMAGLCGRSGGGFDEGDFLGGEAVELINELVDGVADTKGIVRSLRAGTRDAE